MYIQYTTKNRNGKCYTYAMLCKKYREDGKIKTEVVANLSKFPKEMVVAMSNSLKNNKENQFSFSDLSATKSVDYGFVFVLLFILNELRITETLNKTIGGKQAKLAQLMIIGKIVTRGSKLSIFNWIKRNPDIAKRLDINLDTLVISDLYDALEDLANLQTRIEKKWNIYHKAKNEIFLYDITSSYFEGVKNQLAEFGYNRDGKKGKKQIVIGLITTSTGFPLSIEVFEGNKNDHNTVIGQLHKIRNSFGVSNIVFVGDRGMKIRYNLDKLDVSDKEGISYITGLTTDEVQALINEEVIQLSLFTTDIAEIETPEGERYILCRNPDLAAVQNATRLAIKNKLKGKLEELLTSFTKTTQQIKDNIIKIQNGHKNKKLVTSLSLKKLDNYKYKTRKTIEKYNMQAFYSVEITTELFEITFLEEAFSHAENYAGNYVFVTNVPKDKMNKEEVRSEYKNLQHVEHAFRDMKTSKLDIRPIFLIKEKTTRGHILLSMFSYAIIREMETRIFPWLIKYNKENNTKLSFKDIEEELKAIKQIYFNLGKDCSKIIITTLTNTQNEIVKALNIKIE